jgi:hypothetical protein
MSTEPEAASDCAEDNFHCDGLLVATLAETAVNPSDLFLREKNGIDTCCKLNAGS